MESGETIDREIGERVRSLRAARGLTLEALAGEAGVSRAMLSRIERGESSPTAQLLNRVCNGLGVTLSSLFAAAENAPSPLRRRGEQPVWRDPESGYVRRAVSPTGTGAGAEIVAIDFPAGARVDFAAQEFGEADQQIVVLSGTMAISVGGRVTRLDAGDCLHMRFGQPIGFHNPGKRAARYLVVIARGGGLR